MTKGIARMADLDDRQMNFLVDMAPKIQRKSKVLAQI